MTIETTTAIKWQAVEVSDGWEIHDGGGDALAFVGTDETDETRARLMAAAPELLVALRDFVRLAAEDGHGFHDGTEMGRVLRKGQRIVRSILGRDAF